MPSVANAQSFATGINAGGMVVGYSWFDSTGATQHAFVDDGTTMWDLTTITSGVTAGYTLTQATAINDNGWIVAEGMSGSMTHAFLLRPAQSQLPGDANGDGKVDINDLTIVLSHFGQTGMNWSNGDFISDGTVDINDLTIVLTNFGSSSVGSGMSAVPEPPMLLLLAMAAGGLLAGYSCASSNFWRSRRSTRDLAP